MDGLLHEAGDIVRWVPGNHDDPGLMESASSNGFKAATHDGWRIVTLDTRWPGHVAGKASDSALARLHAGLDDSTTAHCVVALHHPPRSFCAHPECQLTNGDAVLEVLSRSTKVRAVLSGHLHRSFHFCRDDIWWIGAPSTCVQADHPSHDHTGEAPAAHTMELHDDGTVSLSSVASRPVGTSR